VIRKHRSTVDNIDSKTRATLLRTMSIKDCPRQSLYSILSANLVMHINLVRTLLLLDTEESRKAVSALIGKPINVMKSYSARARLPVPAHRTTRTTTQRRILHIAPIFKQPDGGRTLTSTDLYRRLGLVKPGMTLEQVSSRGVTRRDIRIAVQRGWIKIDEKT
jgi:hypothetical protein